MLDTKILSGMSLCMKKLSDFSFDINSQFGEDGIIQQIFSTIGTQSKKCIEFGAWDGFHLSNTTNLWSNGWKGILLEGDENKYNELIKNVKDFPCVCINAWVGNEGSSTIDSILMSNQLISDVDFLSVDIDGDDYYVFESLNILKPRVISCEYNPTIPPWIDLIAPKGNTYFGCSALSLVKLAERKGYKLISMTDTNCFFINCEEFEKFQEYDTVFEHLYSTKHLRYLISGFDGKYVLSQEPVFGFTIPCDLDLCGEYFRVSTKSAIDRKKTGENFYVPNKEKSLSREIIKTNIIELKRKIFGK